MSFYLELVIWIAASQKKKKKKGHLALRVNILRPVAEVGFTNLINTYTLIKYLLYPLEAIDINS